MVLVCRRAAVAALAVLFTSPAIPGPVNLNYLYDLADFTGTIAYTDARVVADPARSEVYTLFGNEIRVFNNSGMEIYRFQFDLTAGNVADLAIESNGDILMLVFAAGAGGPSTEWSLLRADFRGRPMNELVLDRPGQIEGFLPNRLLIRSGKIWLLGQGQMRAACFLPTGRLERVLDLAELAGLPPEERGNAEVSGLDVGANGTVVFAVPVQFQVHAIDPGGAVRSFGRSGSAAGNFGVLGDVALDEEGNVFLSDRQRGVVMVFDGEFRFLRETDRAGNREWLARPGALALDPAGRLYVSQVRDRGVAVFSTAQVPERPPTGD